jgi:biotin carboxylase
MISPHKAMLDIALQRHIFCTVIDISINVDLYKTYTNVNLITLETLDVDYCYQILHGINVVRPIDGIVTLTEKAIPIAAHVSSRLNLNYTSLDTIDIIYDKSKMRAQLASHDDYKVPYRLIYSQEDLEDFINEFGLPVIVKPKDGVGSVDVIKINSTKELLDVDVSNELVVEQYIKGEEYSVECFSLNGTHSLIAVTKKEVLGGGNFTEIGHTLPADISPELRDKLERYIFRFLNIVGIKDGPSHTELKIDKDKLSVIETHNRIGGDRISSLVKLSMNIDLIELSILSSLGLCDLNDIKPRFSQYASVRFINPNCDGVVKSVSGVSKLLYKPNIIEVECDLKQGGKVRAITDSFSRYGLVIATGSSFTEAYDNSKVAADSILIELSD